MLAQHLGLDFSGPNRPVNSDGSTAPFGDADLSSRGEGFSDSNNPDPTAIAGLERVALEALHSGNDIEVLGTTGGLNGPQPDPAKLQLGVVNSILVHITGGTGPFSVDTTSGLHSVRRR